MAKEKISPVNQENESAQPPSKEQIISFFQEQINVKKVQYELQELNTKLAVARAEELKALSFISQITNPKPTGQEYEGGTPHTITQEDLDMNPELSEQGIKVGDKVIIPDESEEATDQTESKRSLKK